MSTREPPGWATRPDVEHHVVTCPNCGQVMSWGEYLGHGPDCPDQEEES